MQWINVTEFNLRFWIKGFNFLISTFDYEFKFTGMTVWDVPSENILSIEEIRDYIHMQEKYPDYKGFYDELKS